MKIKNFTEDNIKGKVSNLEGAEINNYYESLLKEMFKAVSKQDYLRLGSLEEILRKSIIITGAKVKNFNLLFSNIKNKVLTEELANYLDVEDMEVLETINITPEYMSLEEAKAIKESEAFRYYEYGLHNIERVYTELFFNDKYTIIAESMATISVLEKGTTNKITFESWDGNLEIFEAFVNNRKELKANETLKVISIFKHAKASERAEKIEKLYGYILEFFKENTWINFEEDNIMYFKENSNFIAVVVDTQVLFIFDKNTCKYDTFVNNTWHHKDFLYKFLDYCLGVETKEEEFITSDIEINDIYTTYYNVLSYGLSNLTSLLNYYEENKTDEAYSLLNSVYLNVEYRIKYMQYLLNKPFITEKTVEPEIIRSCKGIFKDFDSVSIKVLELAKEYNSKMKKEMEELRKKRLELERLREDYKVLGIELD